MKKKLLLLLLLPMSVCYSQIKLASHPMVLKKSSDDHQILNAVDDLNQVFVFAADKDDFHLLKFNSALFFSDSLHSQRPDKSYRNLIGHSFNESGNPTVYWASENFKKLVSVTYDLSNKKERSIGYELELHNESVITTFTEKNIFYIFSQGDKEDFLKLYTFKNGTVKENKLDFSAFTFTSSRNKPVKFHDLLSDHPLEKMDIKAFNPLFFSVQKSKFYIRENKIILTLDHNSGKTQTFSIDLATFTVSEREIPFRKLDNKAETNSYFNNDTLFQLSVNEDRLVLDIKKYPSGELLKDFSVNQRDSIAFKNSPLYIQTGNQKPRDLKTTKKFLRRLSDTDIGLSVYQTQGKQLITIGRATHVASTGDILMGVTLTVGAAIGGGGIVMGGDFFEDNVQSIYFESLLDKNLQHVAGQPEPLAIDYISEFLASHGQIRNQRTFPYKDFFIMGYHDIITEEYVLRKFQDGFD